MMKHSDEKEESDGGTLNRHAEINLSKMDKFLTKIAEKRGLADPTFHLTKGSKDGDNYMGVLYRTEISGKKKDGKSEKVCCFLKCAPMDTFRREVLHARKIFLRELYFYEEVLPVFEDFNSGDMIRAKFAPMLYGSNKTSGEEVLILEDLSCHGFEMKASKILDYPHASLALKRLELKRMEEPLFLMREASESGLQNHSRILCKMALKSLCKEEKHYTQKLQDFMQNFHRYMNDATNGNMAEPYAVVNHGDAWTNNMLFKYEKHADESLVPCDQRFIDFQLCRYASPALDIVYMLFCCCTQELRSLYFDQLLCEYHRSLSECLVDLGCDPATLFPFEALTGQLERFGKFAVGMAIFVVHIFTDEKNEVKEIEEFVDEEALQKRMEEDHVYRTMLRDTLKDLVDRKYL